MRTSEDKSDEVHFLANEFNISPLRAAALVADDEDEILRLAADEREREMEEDLLGDHPVPVSPEEHEVPGNGGLQKTVLRHRNER